MKKLLTILLLAFPFLMLAQPQISQNCLQDLNAIEKLHKPGQKNEYLKLKYPVYTFNGVDYVAMIFRVNASFQYEELENLGAMIGSRIENILSVKFPVSELDQLVQLQGVEYMKVAGKIKPFLDRARYDTKVDSVHAGINLPESYSGKDVLIGVTDWGFDYSSPMFYDTLLQDTRILAAWDQFKTSGPAPSGYAYGTEYASPTDLATAYADTAGVYSYATHGTHVAGIAGGSGAGTAYRGMAYESQFLFVSFLVDESAILDAWQWMYDIAQTEGKPLVVNMSWGLYYIGDLDGSSPLSQAIESYSDLGVVFVTSGGNNGNVNFHIEKDFSNDTLVSGISFYTGGANGQWGQSIHGWGDIGIDFDAAFDVYNGSTLAIQSPWYSTLTTSAYVDTFLVPVVGDTIWYNLSMDHMYPTNNRPQMRLRIKIPPSGYTIRLKSTAQSGKVHFWNLTELTTDVGNWGMNFNTVGAGSVGGDDNYGIGMPACTESCITVAAHFPSYESGTGTVVSGQGANFSSHGPLMNGNMKPDISAPGANITSSINSVTDASYVQVASVNFNSVDYPFAKFSGTSMSSPCVAGIVALMLDANPYLNPWQVKSIIIATARQDNYTGVIPAEGDPTWGHGKINAYAAVQMAVNTVGYVEHDEVLDWSINPNPANDIVTIQGVHTENYTVQIYNLNGQLMVEAQNQSSFSVSDFENGVYLVRVIINGHVQQQKLVVQK